MEAVNIIDEDACKANFLRKYNPDEAYPFWENKMARELDEVEKEIRADEREKLISILKENAYEVDIIVPPYTEKVVNLDDILKEIKGQE